MGPAGRSVKGYPRDLPEIPVLSLLVAAAVAGDPCPIDFRVSNLGPLSKPDQVAIADDPIYAALKAWSQSAECLAVTWVDAQAGFLSLDPGAQDREDLQVWRLQELLLDAQGSFRCDDAHEALAALSAVEMSGHVIYQRGTRRTLLAAAGSQTVCLDNASLEAGGEAIQRLWEGATGAIVADRHANP